MIISEVNALASLVEKACTFTTLLQDGWYKGSAEVAAFRDKVWILSAKHEQWSDQLRRHGLSEDKHLSRAIKAATDELEKQQNYVEKLQKNPLSRLLRRTFPNKLTSILNIVVEAVDAGHNLLAERVDNNDLLERYRAQTPARLPFGRDMNYVPISGSIVEIQRALEDTEGGRVVTVYGAPGMGKSSLVKYLALHYNEMKKSRMDASSSNTNPFPDGVFYLFCGQKAQDRVKQLQMELLESLGFANGSKNQPNDSSGIGVQAGESLFQPLYQMKLGNCLAEQKVLIVVDDLWEEKVLEELLVPAVGVKYLVTSQNRDIWIGATKIKLERPTHEEATQILANFTDGLPTRGEFPNTIQTFTDNIIHKLEYHPLSLANVGISINSRRAIDASHWQAVQQNVLAHLHDNECLIPIGYDKSYNLPLSVSMLLMVESLPVEKLRLLYLLASLQDSTMPEGLVKFFYKFIESTNFISKYNSHEKYLEDRSLLEVRKDKEKVLLAAHGLRTHYIREKKNVDVRSVARQLVEASNNSCLTERIQRGDADETLVTILSAKYFEERFKDVVAPSLENHVKIINGGVIPRTLNSGLEGVDLVDYTRGLRYNFKDLIGFVNVDHQESQLKQNKHEYVKKIIIKFVCQGKLDENSMIHLLQLRETTEAACKALQSILWFLNFDSLDKNMMFSNTHSETMKTLLSLFHDDATSIRRRVVVFETLLHVLHNEREDVIVGIMEKVKELLATDSNPILQIYIMDTLGSLVYLDKQGAHVLVESPEILESLLALLVSWEDRNDSELDINLTVCMRNLFAKTSWSIPMTIASNPKHLEILFRCFLSEDTCQTSRSFAGCTLRDVSNLRENISKFQAIQGVMESLGDMLAKMVGPWRASSGRENREKLEWLTSLAADILGTLALDTKLRETVTSLPSIEESLRFWHLVETARLVDNFERNPQWRSMEVITSTRALTTIYSTHADPSLTDLSVLESMLEMLFNEKGSSSKARESSTALEKALFCVHWTRALAFLVIGMYKEALVNINLAHDLLAKVMNREHKSFAISTGLVGGGIQYMPCEGAISHCRIFLQTMLGDYEGALSRSWRNERKSLQAIERKSLQADVTHNYNYREIIIEMEEDREITRMERLGERGVIKRYSGDCSGALQDLHEANRIRERLDWLEDYALVKQQGLVKYIMGDEKGAREDAIFAQQVRDTNYKFQATNPWLQPWELKSLPVDYLGFSL